MSPAASLAAATRPSYQTSPGRSASCPRSAAPPLSATTAAGGRRPSRGEDAAAAVAAFTRSGVQQRRSARLRSADVERRRRRCRSAGGGAKASRARAPGARACVERCPGIECGMAGRRVESARREAPKGSSTWAGSTPLAMQSQRRRSTMSCMPSGRQPLSCMPSGRQPAFASRRSNTGSNVAKVRCER